MANLIQQVEKYLADKSIDINTFHPYWKAKVKAFVKAKDTETFDDMNDFIAELKPKKKKRASEKMAEQDVRIQGLNPGFDKDDLHLAQILHYESQKAFTHVTGQIKEWDTYKSTVEDLEKLTTDDRSTTSNFAHTSNPLINLLAVSNANLSRLDFMGPGDVEIDTQCYSSMGDRTVDPHKLNTSFGFGTVKIGPDISTYEKEMKSSAMPDTGQYDTLNALEMHRLQKSWC